MPDGALRLIGGRIPQAAVEHSRQRNAIAVIAFTIAKHRVQFAQVIGMGPRSIVVLKLQATQHAARTGGNRARREQALESQGARRQIDLIIDGVQIVEMDGTDRGEITLTGVVGTLGVLDIGHQLRNHEVEVRIPLAVRMRRVIDRHAVDGNREIGAVIQVVAPH